jgi:D-alanine--poly(phosphoribitol) ligase subunit 2
MADRVLAMLAAVTKTDEVRSDLDLELYESGVLDSLGTVQLMVAFSEEFGVELSPAEFEREEWATPRKIIFYMEKRLPK